MTGLLNLKSYLISHISLLKLTYTTHGKDLAQYWRQCIEVETRRPNRNDSSALIIAKVLYFFLTDYLLYQSPVSFFCFLWKPTSKFYYHKLHRTLNRSQEPIKWKLIVCVKLEDSDQNQGHTQNKDALLLLLLCFCLQFPVGRG